MFTKIFADGANLKSIIELNNDPIIKGFTTNPTLMVKSGITNYENFAKEVLSHVKDKPISFEVFADDFNEMKVQAKKIASWADNVYVKIPVMNTKKETSFELIKELTQEGIKVNVTAVFTLKQVSKCVDALANGAPAVVSVFAGRIADTGVNPIPVMQAAKTLCSEYKNIELLWASPREFYNLIEANSIYCDIITMSHDLISKMSLLNKNLEQFSLETVQMFYNDATKTGYSI